MVPAAIAVNAAKAIASRSFMKGLTRSFVTGWVAQQPPQLAFSVDEKCRTRLSPASQPCIVRSLLRQQVTSEASVTDGTKDRLDALTHAPLIAQGLCPMTRDPNLAGG